MRREREEAEGGRKRGFAVVRRCSQRGGGGQSEIFPQIEWTWAKWSDIERRYRRFARPTHKFNNELWNRRRRGEEGGSGTQRTKAWAREGEGEARDALGAVGRERWRADSLLQERIGRNTTRPAFLRIARLRFHRITLSISSRATPFLGPGPCSRQSAVSSRRSIFWVFNVSLCSGTKGEGEGRIGQGWNTGMRKLKFCAGWWGATRIILDLWKYK